MSSLRNKLRKWPALALGVLLALGLCGCAVPTAGFADYDVSAYIQALLDSSYHSDNTALMDIAQITADKASENNTTTVENAAVTFCEVYGISPSDKQREELQAIMRHAFSLTKYTVKDERRVDTGYYLEVEIASITNFENRDADIERLKTEAEQEAAAANNALQKATADGTDDESGDEASSTPVYHGAISGEEVDANELFVEKVLDFCTQEVANVSYDSDTRIVALDIRQTELGELQLDLNQITTIDQTVIRFS